MNLLTVDKRDFLPKDKRRLIEVREKIMKYKLRLFFTIFGISFFAFSLIIFPNIIRKTTEYAAPIYKAYKIDPVITQDFKIEDVNGKDITSVLASNDINPSNVNIGVQTKFAVLTVNPQVNEQAVQNVDGRVLLLHNYLVAHGSPMAGSAAAFIDVADRNHFDWRLLPAIADTESNLGKVIPINTDGSLSYNAFGFGVYNGTFLSFKNWDDAIEKIGDSLASSYGVANLKPYSMEQTYCPPSYLSDHHWAASVTNVMQSL